MIDKTDTLTTKISLIALLTTQYNALGNPVSGTWESTGDKQYSFYVDKADAFTVTLKVGEGNKQTLTLRDSYEVQKLTGHTITMVFER